METCLHVAIKRAREKPRPLSVHGKTRDGFLVIVKVLNITVKIKTAQTSDINNE